MKQARFSSYQSSVGSTTLDCSISVIWYLSNSRKHWFLLLLVAQTKEDFHIPQKLIAVSRYTSKTALVTKWFFRKYFFVCLLVLNHLFLVFQTCYPSFAKYYYELFKPWVFKNFGLNENVLYFLITRIFWISYSTLNME